MNLPSDDFEIVLNIYQKLFKHKQTKEERDKNERELKEKYGEEKYNRCLQYANKKSINGVYGLDKLMKLK
jgi:hypothetical protein